MIFWPVRKRLRTAGRGKTGPPGARRPAQTCPGMDGVDKVDRADLVDKVDVAARPTRRV